MDRILADSSPTLVNVVRGRVLDGACRAIKRPSFKPNHLISIKFMDDIGTTEGAVDQGGPKREFFSLVVRELHDCSMFSGPSGHKFIVPNHKAIEKDMYFLAGVLLALCLAHGCAAPRLFSKIMYQWISYGYTPTRKEASLEDIPAGSEIYDQLHRLNNASTVEDLHQATEAMDTFLEVAGCNIPILAVTDKERIIQACVKFHLLDRVRSCMERFIEGLSTLDVLKTIREHPAACSELFCSSDINLDMDNLIELFHPVLSPVGSNRRVKEVNTLAYFHDYLVCVKDEQTRLKFSDILMFATGSRDVPPCGFETHPQLEFLSESPSCIFPMANTCSCILRLPVVHTEFDGFKEHFEFGILNAVGFGQA